MSNSALIRRLTNGGRHLNAIKESNHLTSMEKLVMQSLASEVDFRGTFREWRYHTLAQLAYWTSMTVRGVQNVIKSLIGKGYMTKRARFENNQQQANEYALTYRIFAEYHATLKNEPEYANLPPVIDAPLNLETTLPETPTNPTETTTTDLGGGTTFRVWMNDVPTEFPQKTSLTKPNINITDSLTLTGQTEKMDGLTDIEAIPHTAHSRPGTVRQSAATEPVPQAPPQTPRQPSRPRDPSAKRKSAATRLARKLVNTHGKGVVYSNGFEWRDRGVIESIVSVLCERSDYDINFLQRWWEEWLPHAGVIQFKLDVKPWVEAFNHYREKLGSNYGTTA